MADDQTTPSTPSLQMSAIGPGVPRCERPALIVATCQNDDGHLCDCYYPAHVKMLKLQYIADGNTIRDAEQWRALRTQLHALTGRRVGDGDMTAEEILDIAIFASAEARRLGKLRQCLEVVTPATTTRPTRWRLGFSMVLDLGGSPTIPMTVDQILDHGTITPRSSAEDDQTLARLRADALRYRKLRPHLEIQTPDENVVTGDVRRTLRFTEALEYWGPPGFARTVDELLDLVPAPKPPAS